MSQRSREQTEKYRGMSDQELTKEINETYRELFTTRLQLATRQMANTSVARKTRRTVARMKTIVRERELAALYQEATAAAEEASQDEPEANE